MHIPIPQSPTRFIHVEYVEDGDYFVAAMSGSNGAIYTSPDGIDWTFVANVPVSTGGPIAQISADKTHLLRV